MAELANSFNNPGAALSKFKNRDASPLAQSRMEQEDYDPEDDMTPMVSVTQATGEDNTPNSFSDPLKALGKYKKREASPIRDVDGVLDEDDDEDDDDDE
eukprot:GHVO01018192.1.p1 GENE.GHVO01018192.1~~GHVO01018192.1.p1  ORF type:complete len:106 (-),score=27.26 GHVO01018192.1:108-404(-)